MKVLVCGGRDYNDERALYAVLAELHAKTPIRCIVFGGARGADTMAHRWAKHHRIPVECFMADWAKYGKAAGPIRNQRMIDEGRPDLVLAFPGGRGTANMVETAKRANVPVLNAGGLDSPTERTTEQDAAMDELLRFDGELY